ncbi:uncharacterized protein BX664DRAFT_333139 [Halteromyces radiatus]|uniref:uncharacterized protein n=1 Tax=Halteromyces radiatus TaxID=101107 RepID=UPI00221FAA94|nr:uncharacterized protein BX664DRAFT_333139 [Halteromyces radiatus]KAI8089490.1 hypothetical protein BX664DRAFT_333139 [Halteromyces radiatus]
MKTIISTCCLFLFVFFQLSHCFSTRKEAQTYLQQYGIPHDELDDVHLLETVKQYRDMAVLNTELFGDRVERLLEGLDKKLEQHYGVTEPHQRQRLIQDIERILRQLEIQGQMTRDHVHEQLLNDNNKIAVSSSHFLTPLQWQDVIKDIEEFVTPPSTWSRWFGRSSSPIKIGDKDPYHTWLDDTTLPFQSRLSPTQFKTLYTALDKAMKREQLASNEWWAQLLKELDGFSADQLEWVVEQLGIRILGFKIFAHDYLGLPTPPPVYEEEQGNSQYDGLRGWMDRLMKFSPLDTIITYIKQVRQHLDDQASTFLAEKKEQGQHVQEEWSKAIQHAQQSFANYWHEKEHDAYRRIGYTEAEIDWIRNYLKKALHHSAPSKSHQIISDIRQYLISLERQTKAQVELHVLKLDKLLQAWKHSILGQQRHHHPHWEL